MAVSAPPYTLDHLRARRADIERIAARYGARNIRVFGSVAAGSPDADSDIDLLVDFGPEGDPADVFAISALLEDALGCRVDVLTIFRDRSVYHDAKATVQLGRVAELDWCHS